jgi:CheY-like chemotaxis protein
MQAQIESAEREATAAPKRQLARVLLADGDLASRLAVKSLLTAVGYEVEGAASAAEAASRLDETDYQLVLADLRTESDEAGPSLLAYARQKDSRPATALFAADMTGNDGPDEGADHLVQVSNEDVSRLLDGVAELISQRADRRIRQSLRRAG